MSGSIDYHKKLKGKIEVISRTKIETKEDLSLAYTPGVAEPCREIAETPEKVYDYTRKGNLVGVITDGSAVLGLGNIGPEASLPVMEGKCILLKEFAGVDAFPIALTTQDENEIVETIIRIAPMFGGINLEDISAPRCFSIEKKLQERLNIPVFHDDQHGTAIVVLAGLYNALKLADKKIEEVKIVISGAGAAGIAIGNLLEAAGADNLFYLDSKGIVCKDREHLNSDQKKEIADKTNCPACGIDLTCALKNADVFIGVSKGGVLNSEMVEVMDEKAIIFAMANPTPEIMPDEAKKGGAYIVATGRSDFPNQLNNVLAFPGIFRGLLDARIKVVTTEMKIAVAQALAEYVEDPTVDAIIPSPLDKGVVDVVARAVKNIG
jgi:malate dehydrogenase (oxaloacetate-decarboxylating)